ncbi:mitochondrial distribution and morphology protein family 31/32 [Laetiporus sulphureus 93-53]|uniref:Mitochondrial distribution and morphology protein family 31/32 n=1 Tax=Laetiporus sulphureus 93-53 TaxID=1314785 RepID=A0A165GSR5_9APHY|nr:mitochondrial distribution and morphology protein family 31/32 [Laetiporus sulphureus 93-53]KZT10759.1 mitochondrial distribution and morphology protein family 31/32 [Laetiporus sulphureus 93-53]
MHEEYSPEKTNPQQLENYSRFFRRLARSLPHVHRPSRDDFLNAANGFWQRARVRFKWLTIRSFRRYNADDISAFVTWFFMSQTLWLFVGTTTFFSVIFAVANSLRLQEYVARAISDYLTAETGIIIIFESAVVPKWKDSRISFKNVYIIRGPAGVDIAKKRRSAIQAGHKVAAGYDVSNHPSYHAIGEETEEEQVENHSEDDTNYSMFDLSVDSVDVTLSFARWMEGRGLVVDAVIKGVRGVLDRREVTWDPDNPPDPAAFRHVAQPGDFELDSLQLEDVLITVYQPGGFRPYTASIFRADIRTFRKQWLFYDFLCAENVVGQFDNCLFSLHKPQSIGRTTEQDLRDGQWARMSRFRMDGVNVDHLQSMTTQEGPFSWITTGKVDAVLDIKFPRDPQEDLPLNALLGELADAITTAASSVTTERIPGQRELAKPPLSAPSDGERVAEDEPHVVIDIDLRFRDLKAAVPLFTHDLSYVNYALIRPIVAFMNVNRTLVPIRCRVIKPLNDFEGSWTLWETGLMDAISEKVYEAMAYHVTQVNFNRRVKAVSAWSLQLTASAMISALKTLVDPVAAHLRDLYNEGIPHDVTFHEDPLQHRVANHAHIGDSAAHSV